MLKIKEHSKDRFKARVSMCVLFDGILIFFIKNKFIWIFDLEGESRAPKDTHPLGKNASYVNKLHIYDHNSYLLLKNS